MTNPLSFLATCPVGLGTLLVDELAELGATEVRETPAGVFFSGSLAGCLPGLSVESAGESSSSQAFRDGRCEYGRCVCGGSGAPVV